MPRLIDLEALEAHCRLAFASWDAGPAHPIHSGLGKLVDNLWPEMPAAEKQHWRATFAPLFAKEDETHGQDSGANPGA